MRKAMKKVATVLAILMACFHFYTGFHGVFTVFIQRGVHIMFATILIFLTKPMIKKKEDTKWTCIIDCLLAILAAIVFGYVVINWEMFSLREGLTDSVTAMQKVIGVAAILLVAEAARRATGLVLCLLALMAVSYAMWGGGLPGILAHRGWNLKYVLNTLYFSPSGIFSSTLGTSASYAALFIIMGALMSTTGISDLFGDIATAIAGRKVGGPAKVSVISSALFGMISGASTANVYSTGVFSIPMMKKMGYKNYFAGAVEAVASTGGQILPPVMGAVAFVMADITGISYGKIALSAAIPAILYYVGVFFMIHLVAKRDGLRGMTDENIRPLKEALKEIYLMIPIVVLIVTMCLGYSVGRSVAVATVATLVIGVLNKKNRLTFKKFLKAMEQAAYNMLTLAAACACAGIVTGVLDLTGLAMRFTGLVMKLSSYGLFAPLALTCLACIILGMGLPTVPAYVIVCSLCVTTLSKLGLMTVQAHMFALYFAVLAAITPPVAVSAFAGASIAEASPNRTGIEAFKLALPGFVIPFAFAYDPALLLVGKAGNIILAIVTATIGVLATTAGVAGFIKVKAAWWERILLLASGVLMIVTGWVTDLIGIALLVLVFLVQMGKSKKQPAAA